MKTIEKSKPSQEKEAERSIGAVLRYGVLVGSTIVSLGLVLSLFRIGSYSGCPSTLEEVCQTNFGRPLVSLGILATSLSYLNPLSIIELGVLILIGIPFFRIVAGALMYWSERDWLYVFVSGFLLAVLLFSALVVGPFLART